MIEPSSCLVVFVSRKAIEPSDSISMVNLMLVLIELRCAWNSSVCSLFMHTWLSSTYLIHHLGEFGADNRAFSSTYSMTRLAKMALTGDPIGQPKICLKWSPWNTKKLLSRTNCKRAMIFWMDKFVLSGSDLKQLEPKLYHKLHSTDSTPASFYGLPKIHKENVPLRPIMSAIGSPTYELSKYLANILSPLQNNKYTVKNSASFVEKIRTMSVDPDEILVSFDVVSLFTCIPTHLAMEVVKERLDFDKSLPERTNLSIQNIIALLQFVLDNNFFVFQGDHFKQIFGCPMGSPVSAILANLVMEYVEEKALLSAPNSPKWWIRYVDDSHVCIKREHTDEFHAHLNSINTNIKFTIEIESEGSIAFLDTKTTRQDDGSITVSVYRKATHTDRYLDFKSHHHPQHKYSVIRTLMDRAKNIPSTEEEAVRETKRVAKALTANNYPANFIYNGRQRNRQQEVNDSDQRGMVVLPYAKGFSEKIARVLRGFNIKVAHKPIRTISNILKKPKDKIEREASRGIVYKIKCKDCDCVYIGQTSRALKTRVKEHSKAIATLDENSLLAKHHMRYNHQIDLMNVEIVDRSSAWRQRLILEAWHSLRDTNAINEHIALPNVYNNIKNL